MNFVMLANDGELSCYNGAMLATDRAKWEDDMQRELDLGLSSFAKG